jgi:hypothetical protein
MKTKKLLQTLTGLFAAFATATLIAQPVRLAVASCEPPPETACTAEGCTAVAFTALGNAIEPVSGREFLLDYPCDLQPGEKVTFILSLHGAGSIGNWQRHYFPALDYKDKYRLVIATPTAGVTDPIRMWTGPADDDYLHNIVDLVTRQLGRDNIASFWLAGHSQGGMTSNRLLCTPYFRDKVDGWLSLSGGRIGPVAIPDDFFGENGPPATLNSAMADSGTGFGRASVPDCEFSYIFASGELEITELPATSPWADKYQCGDRVRGSVIVDTRKGYVESRTPGRPASWGRDARPGTAEVYTYPGCAGGKLVADVLRLDKGHTEGLEPLVTEQLIRMMVAAPGGKMQNRTQP